MICAWWISIFFVSAVLEVSFTSLLVTVIMIDSKNAIVNLSFEIPAEFARYWKAQETV